LVFNIALQTINSVINLYEKICGIIGNENRKVKSILPVRMVWYNEILEGSTHYYRTENQVAQIVAINSRN
jgi:hypothetical protein